MTHAFTYRLDFGRFKDTMTHFTVETPSAAGMMGVSQPGGQLCTIHGEKADEFFFHGFLD